MEIENMNSTNIAGVPLTFRTVEPENQQQQKSNNNGITNAEEKWNILRVFSDIVLRSNSSLEYFVAWVCHTIA